MSSDKILIVEDDQDIMSANRQMLELEGYRVVTATSMEAGREAVQKEHPDLILLDILLPDGNGLELIAEMRESDPALSILVVSSWSTEEIILQALQAGATGYVLKERDDMEMALSIRSVLRGGAPIDPFIARRILHLLQATPPKAEKPSPPPTQEHNPDHEETLTRRESGILQLVAEGLSNREIAERLFLSRHTIECHIKHIYRKLAVSGRTRAVYEARARGLLS